MRSSRQSQYPQLRLTNTNPTRPQWKCNAQHVCVRVKNSIISAPPFQMILRCVRTATSLDRRAARASLSLLMRLVMPHVGARGARGPVANVTAQRRMVAAWRRGWRPQRDSNPCLHRERVMSWASRRWGRKQRQQAELFGAACLSALRAQINRD